MSKHFRTLTRTIAACLLAVSRLLAVSCLLAALCLAGCSPAQAPLPTATQIIPPSATPTATQIIPPSPTPTVTFLPDATLVPMVPADAPFTVYSHPELSGKIAFAEVYPRMVLYTMSADGTGLSQFTGIDGVISPAWSPDGKQIAYCWPAQTATDLYVVNADGSGRLLLPAKVSTPCELFWESDGQRIRFVPVQDDPFEICVNAVKADGSEPAELYNPFNIPELCGGDMIGSPAWSPDGTKFAFTRHDATHSVLNIDGSVLSENLGGLQRHWSPDGSKLAYIASRKSLYIANSDGSERTLVFIPEIPLPTPFDSMEVDVHDLAWSPDGKKIAIVLGCEIAVIDIDGSNLLKLVDGCTVNPRYFFESISWTR